MSKWIPAFAAIIGFICTFLLGTILIPWLKKLKFGQTIKDIGPSWHKAKEGTPTMGGIMMIVGMIIAIVCAFSIAGILNCEPISVFKYKKGFTYLMSGIGLAIGTGLIGFFDDYIKVAKKRNLGLTATEKTVLQAVVTALYLVNMYIGGMRTTWIPFVGSISIVHGFGIVFWIIAFFFIYGFTNAVNLTDGIDGLASSVTAVVCITFLILSGAYFSNVLYLSVYTTAVLGSLLGFLIWNIHPAKVFMGDTGSMFLGGAVVAFSFMIEAPILLIVAGLVYLIEAFSDIIQVAYFKKTGKRFFKMAPIHHHFEKCGWSENKIVIVFTLVTVAAGFLTILLATTAEF